MDDTVPPHAPQDKPNPDTTFIYALSDPVTLEIRYIGKSNDPQHRLKVHMRNSEEATHRGRWMKRLKSLGLKPLLHIIEEVSVDEWQEREHFWIEHYRSHGAPLTNEAPGGIGMKVLTPEILAKIAASKKGKKYPNIAKARTGKKLSPESIEKRSAAVRGRKRPPEVGQKIAKKLKGRKHESPTSETREKLSRAHKGRVKSPEECKHISEAKKGVKRAPFTEEARRNMAEASRGRQKSDETRAKLSASHKGKKLSEEHCRAIGNASRGRKFSPEARANMSLGQKRRNAMKRLPPSDAPTLWD